MTLTKQLEKPCVDELFLNTVSRTSNEVEFYGWRQVIQQCPVQRHLAKEVHVLDCFILLSPTLQLGLGCAGEGSI